MKRLCRHILWILIFLLISSARVCHADGHTYQDVIREAKKAIAIEDYTEALVFIELAHLYQPTNPEPFSVIQQIPVRSNNQFSFRFYYNVAKDYYEQQEFASARFYFLVAYNMDPTKTQLLDMVKQTESQLTDDERFSRADVAQGTPSIVTAPVIVTGSKVETVEPEEVIAPREPERRARRVSPPPVVETLPIRVEPDVARDKPSDNIFDDKNFMGNDIRRMIATYRGEEEAFEQLMKPKKRKALNGAIDVAHNNLSEHQNAFEKGKGKRTTRPPRRKKPVQLAAAKKVPAKKQLPPPKESPKYVPPPKLEPTYAVVERKKQATQKMTTKVYQAANIETIEVKDTIELDDDLWERQPGTVLEVPYGESIILQGRQIKRFLVFDPRVITAQKKDKDSVLVTITLRGTTLFHVWDETGRWTFNVKGIIPEIRADKLRARVDDREMHVRPFRFSYANNWNSFYMGNSMSNLDRVSLTFSQRVGVAGGTPYGFVDASAEFYKFEKSTENTGISMGISNANFGPFEDFTVRGWDTSANFSPLSLPGRSFRGVLFDSFSFNRQLRYTYLHGQDKAVFVTVSDDANVVRKSYIEGAKIILWPERDNQYSINYARGWGEERPDFLRDKVFSFEARNKIGKIRTHFEWAYDEFDSARVLLSNYASGDLSVSVNVRDIEPGFTTAISKPSGRGEVGGNILLSYRPQRYQLTTNLDIYRDREFYNPQKKDSVNIDFGVNLGVPLSNTMRWNNTLFYTDTSQLISPRESLRASSTLTKTFKVFGGIPVTTYLRGNYQMSRYDIAPGSEFDEMGLGAGVRFPIYKDINFFSNYDYAWVEAIETGEKTQPHVHNTGISYSTNFGDKVSFRVSGSYRNEENTEGNFSFLSGTDALRANIGISYRPKPDVEFFLDGSVRNVLAESSSETSFNDLDIRVGMRADWDTIFRWDPTATIHGVVYKDLNRNSRHDDGEPGIEDIDIDIGRKTVTSNSNGYYSSKVRAKMIKMGINFASVPKGYTLMNYLKKDIVIKNREMYTVDFGFITRTAIFGIVFYDENRNKQYDEGEQTIPGARIKLDNREIAASGFEGVYNFYDIPAGDHILMLDVNSLPLEYIPLIKLRHKIRVQEGTTYPFHIPLKKK